MPSLKKEERTPKKGGEGNGLRKVWVEELVGRFSPQRRGEHRGMQSVIG
jgi:hypothetical protein